MKMKIRKQKSWIMDKSQREAQIRVFEMQGYKFVKEDEDYLYFERR